MPFNTTLYLCTRVWMYFTMCQIPLTRANTPRNSRSCTNSCTSSNFERSTHFGNELQTQIDSSLWTSQVILIDQLIVFYKWYHEWYNFQCYHSDYHQRHISFQIRFLLSDKIISSKTRKKNRYFFRRKTNFNSIFFNSNELESHSNCQPRYLLTLFLFLPPPPPLLMKFHEWSARFFRWISGQDFF